MGSTGTMATKGTILVTGGAGFVGSHFVRAACDAGLEVVVLDDLSGFGAAGARPPLPLPKAARFVEGDIGDAARVAALCSEHSVSALVHFAGKIQVGESVRVPELYFDVNLARSLRLLDAVLAAGVRQVVFSSTAAVYGAPERVPIRESARTEPVNPYGRSKLAFEWVLRSYETAHGLRWAAPRYFNAAGAHPDGTLREQHEPETHLIPLVLDAGLSRRPPLSVFGTDYPTPDGTCVRDYIHVMDLASAHLLALQKLAAGEVVGPCNLGTGSGYSVREVLEAAREVLGQPVPHVFGPRREGDPPELVADPGLAGQRLGWKAERSDLRVLIEDALRSRR
jgi:UDP-glucose-4-epimerase GalE